MRLTTSLIIAGLVSLTAIAVADIKFAPKPVKASEAEINLEKDVNATSSMISRLQIAKNYLERHPNDVPMGRFASDVIAQNSERKADAVDYLKQFSEIHLREIGPQYYYARSVDDTLIWDQKARWALAKDSTNYWGWLMWMEAEWHKSKPDLDAVVQRLEHAVTLDPSRPEGYYFLGDAYGEQGNWPDAIETYQAGLICDPTNDFIRQHLEDAKDRLKKSEPKPDK